MFPSCRSRSDDSTGSEAVAESYSHREPSAATHRAPFQTTMRTIRPSTRRLLSPQVSHVVAYRRSPHIRNALRVVVESLTTYV